MSFRVIVAFHGRLIGCPCEGSDAFDINMLGPVREVGVVNGVSLLKREERVR